MGVVSDFRIGDSKAFGAEAVVAGVQHAGGLGEAPDDEGITTDAVNLQGAGEISSEGLLARTEGDFFDWMSLVVGDVR